MQLYYTGLSKKMPARVRDIARARQTRNTTRDLRGPRRTSDVFLDKAVDIELSLQIPTSLSAVISADVFIRQIFFRSYSMLHSQAFVCPPAHVATFPTKEKHEHGRTKEREKQHQRSRN